MEKLNLDKNNLKKFGITMGLAFLIITLIVFLKQRHGIIPTSIISAIFLILAFSIPGLLKPIYIVWMRLAFILGWMNTRLILLILFYLIFMPIGFAMRLFGIDLLDRKINKTGESYWKKREEKRFKPLDYERQF